MRIFIDMDKEKNIINETYINGSRVYVEDGEVKTSLSQEILTSGYMTVEEGQQITIEAVKKIYELNSKG